MQYNFSQFQLVNTPSVDDEDIATVLIADSLTLLCTLHYDTDKISNTYGKWICVLDVVADDSDEAERSFVLYPGTLHFEGDNTYIVGVASEYEQITKDNIGSVYLTIGVPVNE